VTEDAQGDRWEPDWPVFLVTAQAAEAWCAWEAARTGQSWRLPSELEWEKAARGVDGRFFPFGDFLDPSWACMRASHPERPMPAAVSAFPVDESPYGVRGMAGNVRDWCGHAWDKVGAEVDGDRVLPSVAPEPDQARVVRGGRWSGHARAARAASRSSAKPDARLANLGFRPVRPLD
jgi:serine/threonine-protein kinase